MCVDSRVYDRKKILFDKSIPVWTYARDQAADGVKHKAIMADITESARLWKTQNRLSKKEEVYLDYKDKYYFTISNDESEVQFFKKDQGETESLVNRNKETPSGGESSFASISSSWYFKQNQRKIEDPKQIKQQNEVSNPYSSKGVGDSDSDKEVGDLESDKEVGDSESYKEEPTYKSIRLIPSNFMPVDEYQQAKATANMIRYGLGWTGVFVLTFLFVMAINRILTGFWVTPKPKLDSEDIRIREFLAEWERSRTERYSEYLEKSKLLDDEEHMRIERQYESWKKSQLIDENSKDVIDLEEKVQIKDRIDLPED